MRHSCPDLLDPHGLHAPVRHPEAPCAVVWSRLSIPRDCALSSPGAQHPLVLCRGHTPFQSDHVIKGISIRASTLLGLTTRVYCCNVLGVFDGVSSRSAPLGCAEVAGATVLRLVGKAAGRGGATKQAPPAHDAQVVGTFSAELLWCRWCECMPVPRAWQVPMPVHGSTWGQIAAAHQRLLWWHGRWWELHAHQPAMQHSQRA
mmetsp:Transcript_41703/g.116217  ORF Transcript_41703/g.116217 Transcript_41703/m.116217 type:complete len:203 (+) Transcript_41703:740-1348(+)